MKLPWFGNRKQSAQSLPPAEPAAIAGELPPWATGERRVYIRWWIWHEDERCYRHTTSGEEIRYAGPIATPEAASPRWPWHRFDYVHTDLTYPILVEVRDFRDGRPDEPPPMALNRRLNPVVWTVDHDQCRSHWRREQNTTADIPAYGVWLRYEEAFVGAALAWGNAGPLGGRPDEVAVASGWSNGVWRGDLYRRFGYEWKDAADGPFDPKVPGLLQRWKHFGFPRPADYTPVDLDRIPIVWKENIEVVDREVEYGKVVPVQCRLMQAPGGREIHTWVQVFHNNDRMQPGPAYATRLAVRLPGVTGDFYFNSGLIFGNKAWPGRPDLPGPSCYVMLVASKVRVDDQREFEVSFGRVHPNELGKGKYIGHASQGHWIESHLDRPDLIRDLMCALQDAIPASTGFSCVDIVPSSRSFGEASEIILSGCPIAGMANGMLKLRQSLDITIDPYDDHALAGALARAWVAFFR